MMNPLAPLGASPVGDRLARLMRSPNYRDGAFQNPVPTALGVSGSMLPMLKRQFLGKEQRQPAAPIPIVTLSRTDFALPPTSGLRVTWLGHSTTLIEIDGFRVLVDPVWCLRASPSQIIGPKRFHAPPIALGDLPPLDVVLLTHDHYDHLDMDAVRTIARDPARSRTQFVTALGVGAHLESWGIAASRITELDWSDTAHVGALQITAMPARHFSGRKFKRNETLWASWVIAGPEHRVFHSGDTGFFDGIAAVGEKFGPFHLTMIKMGAYDVMWPDIHLDPEGAVRVHELVGGGVLLPIHWGTFNLAFHAWNEPAERVVAAAEQSEATRLVMPRPGQSVEPSAPSAVEHWWR
ncbi:MAG: MBL fold metallo-hydrolase [bacterium]